MPRERYWMGDVGAKDDFGLPITDEFIDGRTRRGPWGIMNPETWEEYGVGRLGVGYGQRYQKQPDGKWKKVEG